MPRLSITSRNPYERSYLERGIDVSGFHEWRFSRLMVIVIVGKNFAILIVWAVISCITLVLFQWYVRRKDVAAEKERYEKQSDNQSA